MKSVINKGRHYHRFWPLFPNGVYYDKKVMDYKIAFDITAKYDLGSKQANDSINKLFGLSFTWDHHDESARSGWNYNLETSRVRFYYYCYVNSERQDGVLCEVPLNREPIMMMSFIKHGYVFEVAEKEGGKKLSDSVLIEHNHNLKWSYRLGDYFGGKLPAPHKIVKKIEKSNYRRNQIGNY